MLSANDPVAAWGGVTLLRERFDIDPCVVTGPSTDNAVGVQIIEQQMKVAAFNALGNGAALGDHLIKHLGLQTRTADAGGMSTGPIPAVVLGGQRLCGRGAAAPARGSPAFQVGGHSLGQPTR